MSVLPFTHLHLHTEYSMLDGALRLEKNKKPELAEHIKELGMNACAMTDHGVMFGAIHFYKTMKKAGVKPLIGIEAYIHNNDELSDKTTKQRFHVCLIAKNEVGYKNLMYLSSMAYIDGFYYYPRINKKLLVERSEGLICSSACLAGELNFHLSTYNEKKVNLGAKGYERAKEVALEYKEIFGDDFYIEIMRHGIKDQRLNDDELIRLSRETGIKLIATNDSHYKTPDDSEPHEAYMCISQQTTINDPKRLKHSVHEFYVKSPQEMMELFADIPEAIINTQEIVDKVALDIKLGDPKAPNFRFTKDYINQFTNAAFEDDNALFRHLCEEGLSERLKLISSDKHEEYTARLEREIGVIEKMGFCGYLLIVWDYIRYAKENGVPVGPGRGSAAGSLAAFALKITDIDPLPYNLLFERFLNPERVSMPDIDTDFCQEKREKVIEYITQKYGKNNVAQVITFGSLLAKGVIRDVARVLDLSYADADKFAKLIPDKLGITLEEAYNTEPKIKEMIELDSRYGDVWRHASALEGLKRNAGTHAAGIVISNEELWHKTPLFKPSNDGGTLATQYDGRFLEDVDLIKFDFLGLKTLTVVDNAVKIIKQIYGVDLDVTNLPMDDKKVFELAQTGHTDGIFQIESGGMQNLVARLKPTTFEDLIAILALYRPGPMESGMLDDFIERKHGRAEIMYAFSELEPILAPTYGVIVYQEQVMQIVQTIGGFSLGGADLVRRGMGKKDIKYILEQKVKFAEGAAAKGLNAKKAEELFDLIEKFAGYGFNKSHSAAYAMITYQTAYLKAHYPSAFMAALLSSERDNVDKIRKYIDEMKRMGIELAPPSIKHSLVDFTPREVNGKSQILFGLGAIKGIGDSALGIILEARKEADFADLADMLSRIDAQKVNKKAIESLTKSGSFDEFGYTRAGLLDNIETIVEYAQNVCKIKKEAAFSLFGDDAEMTKMDLRISDKPEMDVEQKLAYEEETLGIYVSGHPLDQFKDAMSELDYLALKELDGCKHGEEIMIVAMVKEAKKKISAKGRPYGILTISDISGATELTVFEDALNSLDAFAKDEPVCFVCQVENSEGSVRLRAKRVHTLEEAKDFRRKKGYVKKSEPKEKPMQIRQIMPFGLEIGMNRDAEFLEKLKNIALNFIGERPLILVFKNEEEVVQIVTPFKVSDEFAGALSSLAA